MEDLIVNYINEFDKEVVAIRATDRANFGDPGWVRIDCNTVDMDKEDVGKLIQWLCNWLEQEDNK
mgnify:CR=1 FL=1